MRKEDSKASVLRAIRAYCVDCAGGSFDEVRYCPATDCPLWAYRFGKTPRQVKEPELLNKSPFQPGDPEKVVADCR